MRLRVAANALDQPDTIEIAGHIEVGDHGIHLLHPEPLEGGLGVPGIEHLELSSRANRKARRMSRMSSTRRTTGRWVSGSAIGVNQERVPDSTNRVFTYDKSPVTMLPRVAVDSVNA